MIPKYEYTENNHFKWGFGDEWYNEPDRLKQYKLSLGHVTRKVGTFREECIHAAKLIGEKTTKPILVGLSGGNDSQVVCLALREAGVPFSVIIVKTFDEFWNPVNEEDNQVAYEFCKKYDIEYIDYSINLDYYYRDEALDYADKYGFSQHHTIVQCAVMDYVCDRYYYIMAGGDIVFSPYVNIITPELDQPKLPGTVIPDRITKSVWWQTPQPIMQLMVDKGYEGTSKFYLYTPELIASYLQHPVTTQYLENEDVILQAFTRWFPRPKDMWWRCFHMLYKPMMIKQEFPEVIQSLKRTGFEKIETLKAPQGPRTLVGEYIKLLRDAAAGKCGGQVIATPIADLIRYINTPHTEEDCLKSTPLNFNV
jgi:hypothetical protein